MMKSNFQTVIQNMKSNGKNVYDLHQIVEEHKRLEYTLNRDALEHHLLSAPHLNFHSTTNDIAHLMVEIGKSYHPKTVADLSCGIGNILVHCDFAKSVGFEINEGIVEVAKFLLPHLDFFVADSLRSEKVGFYDAIISHFPWGAYSDGRRKINLERDFIERALSRLNDGGVLICLVSNGFLSQKSHQELRLKILDEHHLAKVISLKKPAYINSALKSSILVIEKNKSSQQRTQYIERDSINEVLGLTNKVESDFDREPSELEERWDYSFQKPLSKASVDHLGSYETKALGELVAIVPGVTFNENDYTEAGEYRVLSPRDIRDRSIELTNNYKMVSPNLSSTKVSKAIIREGDIALPRIHMDIFELYIHEDSAQKLIANQFIFLLRGDNAEYVSLYLQTQEGKKFFFEQRSKLITSSILPALSLSHLKRIQIPILPINDLKYASKKKLEELSKNELIQLKDDYEELQFQYKNLKTQYESRPHQEQLNSMQAMLDEVLANQGIIRKELIDIKESLEALSEDFQSVKKLPRDVESKIGRFYKHLDSKLDKMSRDQHEIEFYIDEIKRWFEHYDILEEKSKKYLPEAEYLLDRIAELDDADYSPFILQYCRALENELLKKIFRAYVHSLKERDIDIAVEFEWDLDFKESGKPNDENTRRLANDLIKYLKKPESQWFFELGNMEFRLRFLTGKTVSKSPLLQDFKGFVLNRFRDDVLNIEYLDEIKSIIIDYRNQSAHPGLMTAEHAALFHESIKKTLIQLLGNYKQS